jgi:hypothetical protein
MLSIRNHRVQVKAPVEADRVRMIEGLGRSVILDSAIGIENRHYQSKVPKVRGLNGAYGGPSEQVKVSIQSVRSIEGRSGYSRLSRGLRGAGQ